MCSTYVYRIICGNLRLRGGLNEHALKRGRNSIMILEIRHYCFGRRISVECDINLCVRGWYKNIVYVKRRRRPRPRYKIIIPVIIIFGFITTVRVRQMAKRFQFFYFCFVFYFIWCSTIVPVIFSHHLRQYMLILPSIL